MSRLKQFMLPDLGEGLTEGEILRWMVQPGDRVEINQVIVEVETAKAAVELPSPYAGVVHSIHHEVGTTVDVGASIITVDTEPAAEPFPDVTGPQGALIGELGPGGRTATLVGYGPKAGAATRRPRSDAAAPVTAAPGAMGRPAPARVSAAQVGQTAARAAGGVPVLAKPPVRKLAKELGVDLGLLSGTGSGGTVTRADVEGAADTARAVQPGADRDPATRERRIAVKGVRKHTAAAMVESAFTAPHVTEFLTLDMTPTMELRSRVQAMPDFAGTAVTPLLFVAKALLLAVSRNPEINASWDEVAQEIVVKDYVHLGIAAATPRGLLVPNIKDADQLSLPELARALQELTETARAGRTAPADMTGGTITITNVGAFGVDSGTPILNPGESAILCFGVVRPTPWVVDGQICIRQVTQLSLSFDHRNVDGALGSQFLADIARVLSEPATGLVWG
ncbi:MAG: dihydrolipoamide acetyltransferase family protein [Mycobacteriales bacterium]